MVFISVNSSINAKNSYLLSSDSWKLGWNRDPLSVWNELEALPLSVNEFMRRVLLTARLSSWVSESERFPAALGQPSLISILGQLWISALNFVNKSSPPVLYQWGFSVVWSSRTALHYPISLLAASLAKMPRVSSYRSEDVTYFPHLGDWQKIQYNFFFFFFPGFSYIPGKMLASPIQTMVFF